MDFDSDVVENIAERLNSDFEKKIVQESSKLVEEVEKISQDAATTFDENPPEEDLALYQEIKEANRSILKNVQKKIFELYTDDGAERERIRVEFDDTLPEFLNLRRIQSSLDDADDDLFEPCKNLTADNFKKWLEPKIQKKGLLGKTTKKIGNVLKIFTSSPSSSDGIAKTDAVTDFVQYMKSLEKMRAFFASTSTKLTLLLDILKKLERDGMKNSFQTINVFLEQYQKRGIVKKLQQHLLNFGGIRHEDNINSSFRIIFEDLMVSISKFGIKSLQTEEGRHFVTKYEKKRRQKEMKGTMESLSKISKSNRQQILTSSSLFQKQKEEVDWDRMNDEFRDILLGKYLVENKNQVDVEEEKKSEANAIYIDFLKGKYDKIWLHMRLVKIAVEKKMNVLDAKKEEIFDNARKLEIHQCKIKTLERRVKILNKKFQDMDAVLTKQEQTNEIKKAQLEIFKKYVGIITEIEKELQRELRVFAKDEEKRKEIENETNKRKEKKNVRDDDFGPEDEIAELFLKVKKNISGELLALFEKNSGRLTIPVRDEDNYEICGTKKPFIDFDNRGTYVKPFQKNLARIVSPATSVPRGLLVYHEPGAGKNCEMSNIISTYFDFWYENPTDCPYDKIVLFLSQRNHIKEMYNSMVDECGSKNITTLESEPGKIILSNLVGDNKDFRTATFKKEGRKFHLHVKILGRTMNDLIGALRASSFENMFDKTVVLIDEAHHLFKTNTLPDLESTPNLANKPTLLLRRALLSSSLEYCKVFLFTGTPLGDSPSDVALLNLVKMRDQETGEILNPFPDEILEKHIPFPALETHPYNGAWTKFWEEGTEFRNKRFANMFMNDDMRLVEEKQDDEEEKQEELKVEGTLNPAKIPELRERMQNCISYYDPGFGASYPRLVLTGDVVYQYDNASKQSSKKEAPKGMGQGYFWTGRDGILLRGGKQISETRCDHVIIEQSTDNFDKMMRYIQEARNSKQKKATKKWKGFIEKFSSEETLVREFLNGDFDDTNSFGLLAPKRFANAEPSDSGTVPGGDYEMSNCGIVGRQVMAQQKIQKKKTLTVSPKKNSPKKTSSPKKASPSAAVKNAKKSKFGDFPLFQAILGQMKEFEARHEHAPGGRGIHFIYFDTDNGNSFKMLLRMVQSVITSFVGHELKKNTHEKLEDMLQWNAACILQKKSNITQKELSDLFFKDAKKRVINLVFPNADKGGNVAKVNKWLMTFVNDERNANGEYAKVVIGHIKQKQGFDVKNGVCLHMVTVPTTKQTFEQIKRRILRFCSFSGQIKKKGHHIDTPVEIKLYVQVPPVSMKRVNNEWRPASEQEIEEKWKTITNFFIHQEGLLFDKNFMKKAMSTKFEEFSELISVDMNLLFRYKEGILDHVQKIMREEAVDCKLHCKSSHRSKNSSECAISCGGRDIGLMVVERDTPLSQEEQFWLVVLENLMQLNEELDGRFIVKSLHKISVVGFLEGYIERIVDKITFIRLFKDQVVDVLLENREAEESFDSSFVEEVPEQFKIDEEVFDLCVEEYQRLGIRDEKYREKIQKRKPVLEAYNAKRERAELEFRLQTAKSAKNISFLKLNSLVKLSEKHRLELNNEILKIIPKNNISIASGVLQ